MRPPTEEQIKEVIKEFEPKNASLVIPVLQKVQKTFGYVPPESLQLISRYTNVARSRIYGVLTFYEEFRTKPSPKYKIRVCHGIACRHNPHYSKIVNKIKSIISHDNKFVLESIACPGPCYHAPIVMINDDYYANLTEAKLTRILRTYK
jgi:NADH-quinone oxidoreductase subunit E